MSSPSHPRPGDPLLQRHHEANARDSARPDPALRERVLAEANAQATLRALGGLAVLGLVGRLTLQFDRGTPEEREAAFGTTARAPVLAPASPPAAAPTPMDAPVTEPTAQPDTEPAAAGPVPHSAAVAPTPPRRRAPLSEPSGPTPEPETAAADTARPASAPTTTPAGGTP